MSFQDTYQSEVLQSRRVRSQRAQFWAKVVGVLLMLVIGATLRSEPQLRQALMSKGMDGVMKLTGKGSPTAQQQTAQLPGGPQGSGSFAMPDLSMMPNMADLQKLLTQGQSLQGAVEPQSVPQNRPRDAVRVNRFGSSQGNSPQFQRIPQIGGTAASNNPQSPDANGMAIDLNRLLQAMNPGQ